MQTHPMVQLEKHLCDCMQYSRAAQLATLLQADLSASLVCGVHRCWDMLNPVIHCGLSGLLGQGSTEVADHAEWCLYKSQLEVAEVHHMQRAHVKRRLRQY